MSVSERNIERAIERYRAGASIAAAATGICSPMTLWRRMRERGEPIRGRGPVAGKIRGPVDLARTFAIYRRHRLGEPASTIAASVGMRGRAGVLRHVWMAERVLLERQAAELPRKARAA